MLVLPNKTRFAEQWATSLRKQADIACRTTHLSTGRGTRGHLFPSDLCLLLNDELKTPSAIFRAEHADKETHAHPSTNTVTNVPLNWLFIPLRSQSAEWLTKPPVISFYFPGEELDFHVHACYFVFKHSSACKIEVNIAAIGEKKKRHFSIPIPCIVPWFADTQCALIDRLVFPFQSVCECVYACVHVNVREEGLAWEER